MSELRLITRDELTLIEQRTMMVCQLRAALSSYYMTAIEAFDDWTAKSSWEFILKFPTPSALVKAGRRRQETFLHKHKLWRTGTAQKRLDIFEKADQWKVPEPVVKAKSMLAISLVNMLLLLEKQLADYRKQIEKLFKDHDDHDTFNSLPGAGPKLAPRLMAEIGADRNRFQTHENLQTYAGTPPVTFQSGQIRKIKMRYACSSSLRNALHHFANASRLTCAWAQAYYMAHREKGKSHACALRCLAQRWIKIIWKLWQTKTTYDEAIHTKNQVKHGSWLLQLSTKQALS